MSLTDILDEIRGGVDDIDEITLKDKEDISTEEIRSLHVRWGGFRVEVANIDKDLMAKFNNLYRRCTLKRSTAGMTKVDRSIAQEAMATLPAVSPVHLAKLTSAPSSINKKIIDDIVFNGDDKVPEDILAIVKGLYEEIKSNHEKATSLYTDTVGIVDELKGVIESKGVDKADYLSVFSLNASDEEAPYVRETIDVIRELTNSFQDNWAPTGKELIDGLEMLTVVVRHSIRSMETFVEKVEPYLKKEDKELDESTNEIVGLVEPTVNSLERFNKLVKVIDGESSGLMVLKRILERL